MRVTTPGWPRLEAVAARSSARSGSFDRRNMPNVPSARKAPAPAIHRRGSDDELTRRRFVQTTAATGAAAALLPATRAERRGRRRSPPTCRHAPARISSRSAKRGSRRAVTRLPDRDAVGRDARGARHLQPRGHAGVPEPHPRAQRGRRLRASARGRSPARRRTPTSRSTATTASSTLRCVDDDLALAMAATPTRAWTRRRGGAGGARLRRADRDQGHLRDRGRGAHARLPADKGQHRDRGLDRRRARPRRRHADPRPDPHRAVDLRRHLSADRQPVEAHEGRRRLVGRSAAAVRPRGCRVLTVGSDTANSVRNPSCNTGAWTIKPTYGLIPLYGVTPLTVCHDHAGPICRSMIDVAILLGILAGPDSLDPRSLQSPPRPAFYPLARRRGDKPFEGCGSARRSRPRRHRRTTTWAPGIRDRLRAAVEQFRALGATIVDDHAAGLPARRHDVLQGLAPDLFTGNASAPRRSGATSENAYVLEEPTRRPPPTTRCSRARSARGSADGGGRRRRRRRTTSSSARRRSPPMTSSAPTASAASTARSGRRSSPTTTSARVPVAAEGADAARPGPTTSPAAPAASSPAAEHDRLAVR